MCIAHVQVDVRSCLILFVLINWSSCAENSQSSVNTQRHTDVISTDSGGSQIRD